MGGRPPWGTSICRPSATTCRTAACCSTTCRCRQAGVGGAAAMGHVDLSAVGYHLPDGRVLLDDVSFRVGEGAVVALVGPNGSGETPSRRDGAGAPGARGR